MQKIRKGKREKAESIIKDALRGRDRTRKELIQLVKNEGWSESTAYRTIQKLERRRDIAGRYSLVKGVYKEADEGEVRESIERLKSLNDKEALKYAAIDFVRLCDDKRVAHYRNVLAFIEDSLLDPKFQAPEILSQMVRALYCVLRYEGRIVKSLDIVDRIKNQSSTIKKIIEEASNPKVINEALFFLAETGEKEAVELIFDLVMKLPDDLYQDIRGNITNALFNKVWTLYEQNHKLINNKIYCMLEHSNDVIKERAKFLHSEEQQKRYY